TYSLGPDGKPLKSELARENGAPVIEGGGGSWGRSEPTLGQAEPLH
ncbi:MAG: hypothetical protein QG662_653, partial [Pseudomonadota bacterium]|nr:hypothetical protein [Pseudomonadota bacterium]